MYQKIKKIASYQKLLEALALISKVISFAKKKISENCFERIFEGKRMQIHLHII